MYGIFPFSTKEIEKKYHLVIIGKPGIPLMADVNALGNNFSYVNKNGVFPEKYLVNNLPEYYINRNISALKFLQKQKWVKHGKLILAGHSEGSTIAVRMANNYKAISHLIYSGGNPMGRITSIIQEQRAKRNEISNTSAGENEIEYWKKVVANKNNHNVDSGDSYKNLFDFSDPSYPILEGLKIPVLITYGTKDWAAPYIDYMRVDMIRKEKKNIQSIPYVGCEHNYFPVKENGEINYAEFNWDNVALDWLRWIEK